VLLNDSYCPATAVIYQQMNISGYEWSSDKGLEKGRHNIFIGIVPALA
jgi:hypothetical protein